MDKKEKFNFIEFIRGTAALMVMLEHLWAFARDILQYNSKLLDVLTEDFFNIGQAGVVSFFMITGYLVPWSCYHKSTKGFIVSCVLRIYPVYMISILGLSITAVLLGKGYSGVEILMNLTLFQMFFGIGNINGASWVLPYDITIYILCIIFKKYLLDTQVVLGGFYLLCTGILGAAFIRGRMQMKLPVGIMLLFAVALLGHILRMYQEKLMQENKVKVSVFSFYLVTLVSVTTGYYFNFGNSLNFYNYFSSFTLAPAFFIYLYKRKRHTNNRGILSISKISYSLFLMHPVAFELFQVYRDGYIKSIFLVMCILVAFITAGVSYCLIEAPCQNIQHIFLVKQKNK